MSRRSLLLRCFEAKKTESKPFFSTDPFVARSRSNKPHANASRFSQITFDLVYFILIDLVMVMLFFGAR